MLNFRNNRTRITLNLKITKINNKEINRSFKQHNNLKIIYNLLPVQITKAISKLLPLIKVEKILKCMIINSNWNLIKIRILA